MSANEEAVNSCKLIVGTWKCDAAKSENFEEMLSHVGELSRTCSLIQISKVKTMLGKI